MKARDRCAADLIAQLPNLSSEPEAVGDFRFDLAVSSALCEPHKRTGSRAGGRMSGSRRPLRCRRSRVRVMARPSDQHSYKLLPTFVGPREVTVGHRLNLIHAAGRTSCTRP
jgi:hypothetical protein